LKQYQHIFFDLDHTLWDFETNCRKTLLQLYDDYALADFKLFSQDDFYKKYRYINHRYWTLFAMGKVTQDELRKGRFEQTFVKLGVKRNQIPADIGEAFLELCPQQSAVFPFTHEVLQYLKQKYKLHIITNGFSDVQHIKMASAGIDVYFEEVITSSCINIQKPDKRIFLHALERANTTKEQSLMVGDNLEADVLGAKAAGLDQVFFNPEKRKHQHKPTYEISCLSNLMQIL